MPQPQELEVWSLCHLYSLKTKISLCHYVVNLMCTDQYPWHHEEGTIGHRQRHTHESRNTIRVKQQARSFPQRAGADPGFLERGFTCIKVWGSLWWFISFLLNIPWKWSNLVWTKLFHFHRICKNGGRGGRSSELPEPLSKRTISQNRDHTQNPHTWWSDNKPPTNKNRNNANWMEKILLAVMQIRTESIVVSFGAIHYNMIG